MKQEVPTIAAAKFKEQCLKLLEEVGPEGLIVTKHGKPVARLYPAELQPKNLIGSMKGEIKVCGDILSTGASWHAQS